MEAVIGDVHIARDDDTRVLRKRRQDGRGYRSVRRCSADGSLYKLISICIVNRFVIRRVPNLDGRIRRRHVRFGNDHIPTRIYDYRGTAIKKQIAVVSVEGSNRAVKMG